jgi:hypothetical protein
MEDKEVKKLMRQLKGFAYLRIKNSQDREDFISYALERHLTDKKLPSFTFVLADFFRDKFGRSGKNREFELKENQDVTVKPTQVILTYKNRVSNACFMLRYLWGFNTREIAQLFDVTDGWVSQKLKEAEDWYGK